MLNLVVYFPEGVELRDGDQATEGGNSDGAEINENCYGGRPLNWPYRVTGR
jgi:hypothetical protein